MSVASIVSVMATGRYELAIMLPKKDEDAINIVVLSIIISFLVSFITFLIVFFFNTQITNILGNPKISFWLYFIPLAVLLTGFYQSFNYWSNRKKEYKRLAQSGVLRSFVTAFTNIGMGIKGLGSNGLILSGIFGQIVATVFLGKDFFNKNRNKFYKVEKIKIFLLIKKYKKFPIFNLPNAFIDKIRLSGINILISKFFSVSILGQYSLAWKTVQLPISLVGSSISQVFFQKISTIENEKLYSYIRVFFIRLIFLSMPIFIFLYFFAVDIFAFVFGTNWKLAGEIVSILTPWLFLNFLTSPMSQVFIILNKQDKMLIFSIFYMLIPILIIFFLHEIGFLELLKIITISMVILLSIFLYLIFADIRKI